MTFILQNYELDVYLQRVEMLETVQHPCKVTVMDHGLDAYQIFTTLNKDSYTNFEFLYLTEMYLLLESKFFPGKLHATKVVFI